MNKKGAVGLLVLAGLVIWFVIGTRPWWHGIFMIGVKNPALFSCLAIAVIVGFLFSFVGHDFGERSGWFFGSAAVTFFLALCILLPFQFAFSQCHIAKELKYTKIEKLPNTAAVRILPKGVAKRYAMDAIQYPRFQVSEPDISFIDNEPAWVFPIVPDGMVNFFRSKGKGALYIKMGTAEKNSQIIEEDITFGPGMGIRDNWLWQVYKRNYWREYEKLYYVPYNNAGKQELYLAAAIVRYEWHYRFPIFYAVPRWDGTVLISAAGEIRFLSPQEAQNEPILKGQKLFPEQLADYYINSLRYNKGIKNRLWVHEDQLEVPYGNDPSNQQPYILDTEDGIKWFIACEPAGSKSHGVFKIFLIDARRGVDDVKYYEPPAKKLLTGPISACDYVRKNNPQVSWDQMKPVEPLPVVRNNILFWEIRIVPEDGAGVAYTAFVDAENNSVVEYKSDAQVISFIQGKIITIETVTSQNSKTGKFETPIMIITIEQKDGTRKTIPIYRGEKITIEP